MPNAQQLKWDRLPATGNHIVQEFTASGVGRPILVRFYEQWTFNIEFIEGATGTVTVEVTPDNRSDVNLTEGQHAGDPELNNWIDLGATTDINARIREPDDTLVYQLSRINLTSIVATGNQLIRVTFIARQFVK